jgi:trehalose utilization protein
VATVGTAFLSPGLSGAASPTHFETKIRVLVWDENPPHVAKAIYPQSIRGAIAEGLRELGGQNLEVQVAHLDEPEQGCSMERLRQTDVLIWWGHVRHGQVSEETVERIRQRVHHEGMGLIVLHSGHYSKPFQRVLGCSGHLKGGWREKEPPRAGTYPRLRPVASHRAWHRRFHYRA